MIRNNNVALAASLLLLAEWTSGTHGFLISTTNNGVVKLRQPLLTSTNGGAFVWPNRSVRSCSGDQTIRCFTSRTGHVKQWQRESSFPLYAKKDDNDNEKDPSSSAEKRNEWMRKWKAKMPQIVVDIWSYIMSMMPDLKIGIASFVAGAVIGIGLILVPVYNSVDTMSEPVTLFETILSDLDRGYVDNVDTKKLFETGVSAMLRSLDPYTEFESKQEAVDLSESVSGKYGGIGLVISGTYAKDPQATTVDKILPEGALEDSKLLNGDDDSDMSPVSSSMISDDDDDDDGETLKERMQRKKALKQATEKGIRVVTAFEGYAFDYGMRVGDQLVAIDGQRITSTMNVEAVRNKLRGEPGTKVDITFMRVGVPGETTLSISRKVVQIRDVKLTTLIGKPENGVGYIQLSGFTANAGREVRGAILALQAATEEASGGQNSLQSLILDLRGNPGGLLTSAVDVTSCFVPKGSDIVSARGRGFPGVLYRSRIDPVLSPNTKLAVLINGQTASAAEIVSGAVQDLDVGIIVGSDRTFGKGLVQNVEELPFDTALKFTVAKYFTPSGRCIQSTNYLEGGGLQASNGGYRAQKVADKDKSTFYTKNGREVKDGGGVEADFKISTPRASALEVTLLRSGVFTDYAAEWSKKHVLTKPFNVDEDIYRDFQKFVTKKQNDGDIKLEALYSGTIDELGRALKQSGYKGSTKELERLKVDIVREMERDFQKYRTDIKEDIGQNILARYLPDSMLLERGLKTDKQIIATVKLLDDKKEFNKLLSRIDSPIQQGYASSTVGNSLSTASSDDGSETGIRLKLEW
eukprot:CAMPEP_0197826860 /NCGR_PEP_ID=MMETSP1437-20131217/3746_1 /TAXON_ID=49252 ORGANISM="Eucampia antarctica, Strain CCMP1452" /NCGR_SAMPLE_ID=MMETSP1437 /ASSEMBLY_ACC=CAM_ASM_001096 /LENGTH=806 /DNA_ID=CAMNT_0043427469 /DNA_START=267 /DNA_END=2687 /DNA_ORIENTATION=-